MIAGGAIVAARFSIEAWVGAGGAGEVYRARDRETGALVALKVHHERGEGFDPRLVREAKALAALRHPSIVGYVAHGVWEERPYLAMEWVEGPTLKERIARGMLSVREALAVAIAIADALGVAHEHGIVHRDIKPSNVILRGDDCSKAVLADFGVARLAHATEVTEPGTVLGTASYMSPEQARALPGVDARADVFAVGAMIFHALSGHPPFDGEDILSILVKVLFHEPPALDASRADVPHELAALVTRLLAKDPADRPANGSALARLLRQINPAPRSIADGGMARSWSDRRLYSIVLAHSPPDAGEGGPVSRQRADPRLLSRLTESLAPFGAKVSPLADGSFAALLAERPASDLALAAARSALVLRASLPAARVAVAMGLDDIDPTRPSGLTIDRAAKLARDAGEVGTIRVDESTAALLAGRFVISEEHEERRLGREIDQQVSFGFANRATPFVGRDREVSTLLGLVEESSAESVARAAIVVGGPGSGKTRLLAELVGKLSSALARLTTLVARCEVERAGTPLAVVAQLVLAAAGAAREESPEVIRAAIDAHVARRLPPEARTRVSEFLAELSSVKPLVASDLLFAARLDPRLMADQAERAFAELLGAELAVAPVLVIVEDAHLADAASIAWLDRVLRSFEQAPLTVVVAARPSALERFPELFRSRDPLQLPLASLSPKSAERLVRATLGKAATDSIVRAIVSRGAGHPFFLEELARAAIQGKTSLPDTVIALAQSRLEGLAREARRLVRAASIFGEVSWVGGARAIMTDLGEEAALAWVVSLVDQEIFERRPSSRVAGDVELRFRHALLREAAYATWSPEDLTIAHGLAGAWLEEHGESDPSALAIHFERAGLEERAREALGRAAEQALRANDLDGAIEKAEHAIGLGACGEERATLHYVEAQALAWRGDRKAAERPCLDALEAAVEGGRTFFEAGSLALEMLLSDRDQSRVAPIAERIVHAVSLGPSQPGAARARFFALSRVVVWALYAGRQRFAEDVLARLEAELAGDEDHALAAGISRARAAMAQFRGRLDEYLAHATEATQHVDAIGDQRVIVGQRLRLGCSKLSLGLYADAERDLTMARDLAEELRLADLRANAIQNLSIVWSRTGRSERGLEAARESMALYSQLGDAFMAATSRKYLAEGLLDLGRIDEAADEANRAAVAMQAMPPMAASAIAVLARALLRSGHAEDAARASEGASRVLTDQGVDEGEAMIRLVRIEALEATGRKGEMVSAIRAAEARLSEQLERLASPASKEAFSAIAEHAAILGRARQLA